MQEEGVNVIGGNQPEEAKGLFIPQSEEIKLQSVQPRSQWS